MPFTKYAVETFITDKITKVTECSATDVLPEFPSASQWLSGFGLMVMFVDQPRKEIRPFALQFLRRVEMAISEYSQACKELQGLVSGDRGRWSPYFRALYHFEASLGQLYQAYDLSRKVLGKNFFAGGDGTPLDRLNQIYNNTKHQRATEDQPVWISNSGIETTNIKLSFHEIEELLRSYGRIAVKLTSTSSEQGGTTGGSKDAYR